MTNFLNPNVISSDASPVDLRIGERYVILGSGTSSFTLNFPSAAEVPGGELELLLFLQGADICELAAAEPTDFFFGNTYNGPPPLDLTAPPSASGIAPFYRVTSTSVGGGQFGWRFNAAFPTNLVSEHTSNAPPWPLDLGFADADALTRVGPSASSVGTGFAQIDKLVPSFTSVTLSADGPLVPWQFNYVVVGVGDLVAELPDSTTLPPSTCVVVLVLGAGGGNLSIPAFGADTVLGGALANLPVAIGDVFVLRTNGVGQWWVMIGRGANIPDFVGDSGTGGVAGLVPAPPAGSGAVPRVLTADGGWSNPQGNTISAVTATGAYQVPLGQRVIGAWMAPGAAGGGGGGSGGPAFANGAAGGGGGGGSGGQGGGGVNLQYVALHIDPETNLTITIGGGGNGGAGGANVLPPGPGNAGSPGSPGTDTIITDDDAVVELARASVAGQAVPAGGRGGLTGAAGSIGAGGVGGAAPVASGGGDWPYWRALAGQYGNAGANGGDPGVNGSNTTATTAIGNPGTIGPTTSIASAAASTGGAQADGTHGGGGAGAPGGAGGLGWEYATVLGNVPANTVGKGANGINGVAGQNSGGGSGNNGAAGTFGRGGGGGCGGAGGGHSAALGGRSGDGGNGGNGSPGVVILILTPAG